jgi:hypothetical protein
LAALIAAYQTADAPGNALRATLPLAGRTLLERQARLAAAAGADPIVILVERLPPDLLAAIDRMRTEGIGVVVARTVDEAAASIDPSTRLLLFADGLVADHAHIARLMAAGGPALLTVPDHMGDERFERIDSQSLWAGLALIDGQMLRQTAAMLGDWDLQSTLLRHAVQSGARQFALRGEASDDRLTIAETAEDLEQAQALIVQSASAARGGWISRFLLRPAEQLLTRLLMPAAVTPNWLYVGAASLTALAAILFGGDWLGAGMLMLLLATPLDGAAERLSMLRMEPIEPTDWWSYTLPAVSSIALISLGYSLAETHGWGSHALVASVLAFMLALYRERKGHEVEGRIWLAEPKGMAWLLLPFALAGQWTTGLGALALYAAGSFFWAQHQVHGAPAPPPHD